MNTALIKGLYSWHGKVWNYGSEVWAHAVESRNLSLVQIYLTGLQKA